MTEWFEHPEFWERLEPFLFHHLRNPGTVEEETDNILKLLDAKAGQSVLDLCCGTGRNAVALARRHMKVTGVDITPAYLHVAGSKAKQENLPLKLVKEDVRKYCRPSEFHFVINMWSSFGYFENQKHDFKVLHNIFESLKPGGKCLLDLMGREVLKRVYHDRNWFYDTDTTTYLLQSGTIKGKWEWVENKWTLIRGQHQKTYTFGIRIYSKEEITKALQDTGFTDIQVFGNVKGEAYNEKADRLIVLATK